MIRFINITHLAGDKELFEGLTWHIRPGERVGLIGDNGVGKTTLLRMSTGETEPMSGEVVLRRHANIGYLKQEIQEVSGDIAVLEETMKAFQKEQEIEERIAALYDSVAHLTDEDEQAAVLNEAHDLQSHIHHHDAGSAESDAKKILVGLGFSQDDFDRPLSQFSGGWQMRAHIARLLLESPDLLLLDEPTNHLDLESIEWLEQFLTSFPGAVVVVSHDRYFLDRITTRTAWMTQKRILSFTGNYSQFLVERELQEDLMRRRYENQQEEIAHIEKFIERFRYKASKASMVQSRVKSLEKLERVELPAASRRVRLRIPAPAPAGRQIVELRNVRKSYDANLVLNGVDLMVEQGDKIALVGRNGAGKSTLLKILAGVLDYQGERLLHPKTQVEYFSQHRIDTLNLNNTLLEESRPAGVSQTDEQLRSLLGCFLFSGDDVFKPVSVLSGGEKSRLAFARMLLRRGNLLLLDEPTNHLDIATRDVLRNALHEFNGAVVMISHDRSFIDGIANKIVEVADQNIRIYPGNYSEYLEKKGVTGEGEADLRGRAAIKADNANEAAASAAANRKLEDTLAVIEQAKSDRGSSRRAQADDRKTRTKQRSGLRARMTELQNEIDAMETRFAEISALQAQPDAYSSGAVTPEISAEGKRIEQSLPGLLDEWQKVAEEHESLSA
ncbi:ABC transporter ATP-binding protein [candidate division BRC1 bacterium HGW-BRC1-1]|jgi:ATP-binding cassette subfamily F protein 3|nr:MAG: ABC transporter ATP-binding protein [candidate division BRC1 bacterium HGW-BRC1-1]